MATPLRTAKKLLIGREIAWMIDTTTAFKSESNERLSHAKAAKLIETSQTRLTALTNGTGAIAPGDLVMLANKLGFTDEHYHEVLLELRRDSHKRGFWSTGYMRAYHEDVRLLVDLERYADLIRTVEVEIVPGLAQCEAYARALHEGAVNEEGITVEEYVQARLARQHVLDQDHAPEYRLVLSESCLRREYGGPEVMREQIEHLIQFSQHRNVFLQVLPFRIKTRRAAHMANRFVLIRVPSPGRAAPLEMAYSEADGEIRYMDDQKALAARTTAWDTLSSNALNFEETRLYLTHVSNDWARLTRKTTR
jgi:uncharacterized protein DUF5753